MKKNVPKEIWKAAMGAHMMTVSAHKQQTPWLSHAQCTIPVLETIFLEWWLSCFRPRELLRTPLPKALIQALVRINTALWSEIWHSYQQK